MNAVKFTNAFDACVGHTAPSNESYRSIPITYEEKSNGGKYVLSAKIHFSKRRTDSFNEPDYEIKKFEQGSGASSKDEVWRMVKDDAKKDIDFALSKLNKVQLTLGGFK